MKRLMLILVVIGLLSTVVATAKTSAKEAAEKGLSAITIFMDVNKLTRKNLAAKKMTQYHNEFAAYGFQLMSVEPYTENGDLEGFFLSYQKK